jgi:hypothetical protein
MMDNKGWRWPRLGMQSWKGNHVLLYDELAEIISIYLVACVHRDVRPLAREFERLYAVAVPQDQLDELDRQMK